MTVATSPGVWRQRALSAWEALARNCRTRVPGAVRVHEPEKFRVVFAWPLSQVLHSAAILEAGGKLPALGTEEVWRSFRRYRRADGFTDIPVVGERYYDDNAWIGLACAQAALFSEPERAADWLRRAEASLRFVSQGIRPGGGVLWVEGGSAVHSCSTGSFAALAAGIEAAGGRAGIGAARAAAEFIEAQMITESGLVADSLSSAGERDDSVFTYNQGLAIRMRVAQGDLDGAQSLARAVAGEFDEARYWDHAACFNAIHCRALLFLDAVGGAPVWREFVSEYAERCWHEGRDGRGLLTKVGKYDSGIVLDHSALAGLFGALALDREQCARLL